MDRIAFIGSAGVLYWNSIVLTLAAAVAICFFLAFYLPKSQKPSAGFAAVPLSLLLGLFFARLIHWYCRTQTYDSFLSAITDFTSGGYALIGVFLGCLLAAVILRLMKAHQNLPQMLDCMCVAGCAGICVGRLASFFNSTDRGQILANAAGLPFAYPVTNVVSGATEYRLATFVIQAMVAGLLFIGLTIFMLYGIGRKERKDGEACMIFLLIYGASQVVLDSTRYDSLFFRSNGFVSIVQVMSAIALAAVIIMFSVRMVKAGGFRFWYLLLWLPILALIGAAGFMEYYVQRHGSEAPVAYSVMSVSLLAVILITLIIRAQAIEDELKKLSAHHMRPGEPDESDENEHVS